MVYFFLDRQLYMLHGAGLNYNATVFRTGNGCFPPRRNTFEKKSPKDLKKFEKMTLTTRAMK